MDERLLRARVYAENDELKNFDDEIKRLRSLHYVKVNRIDYQAALILFDYGYFERASKLLAAFGEPVLTPEEMKKEGFEVYSYLAYAALEMGRNEDVLRYLRKSIDMQDTHLTELFAEKFPNVRLDELYDYVYYHIHGRWPE